MRANKRIVFTFGDFEKLLERKNKGTKALHVVQAECNNEDGIVVFHVLSLDEKPLCEMCRGYRELFSEYGPEHHRSRTGLETHKCIDMPDGYLLYRSNKSGDWYYQHLGDSMPIVEFCPHCGTRLE